MDEFGEHHSHSRTIVAKNIIHISIIVGKHKVQTVPEVVMAMIIANLTFGNKFEVDTIP